MASFSAGTTFTDGVANDVTAAKLGALVNNATPTSGFIQDRTAETVTATNDTLLIGDASDSNNLKRITVANFAQTLPTAKITTGTIEAGTFGTTTSTAESVTTGTITTLTAGTTTSTAATITTGTIPTLIATTLITSGTGTAAAPAIVPTGDTNTGIFFPAADTIAFSEGGTEAMRIDSSGNVGIGTTSPSVKLHVSGGSTSSIRNDSTGTTINEYSQTINYAGNGSYLVQNLVYGNGLCVTAASPAVGQLYQIGTTSSTPVQFITGNTERLRIDSSGNVGIGMTPNFPLDISSSTGNFRIQSTTGTNLCQAQLTNGSATLRVGVETSVGGSIVAGSAAYSGVISNASNFPLAFGTNNTERLRIDSSGFVSIGTATALSALHVHGNVTLSNTTTATSAGTGGLSKPATYAGYLTVSINGTSRKIPYYAT